jgi:aldose sugar dehydrogenase
MLVATHTIGGGKMPFFSYKSSTFGIIVSLFATAFPNLSHADSTTKTSIGNVEITTMAKGLDEPWSLSFLPDGRFLVTERAGRLQMFPPEGGKGQQIGGVPKVYARGQGGLLDVMIPRDFDQSREVFLSFSQPQARGAGTAMGRGTLTDDGKLADFTTLFSAPEGGQGGRHFGSRIVEAPDGIVFLTVGERGTPDLAQDPTRAEGKVLHFSRDGLPIGPDDTSSLPGLHSLGHRNPQGAALDANGQLWVVEHGAQGGDELNRVEENRNYGWPIIAYGKDYDDSKLGVGSSAPGLEQPVHYWDPSIAPSGLMFYTGDMFPEWQGDVFTGSLKFNYISRLDPDNGYVEETITANETGRVRDVRQAPDGSIWFLSVVDGAVYRMARSPD